MKELAFRSRAPWLAILTLTLLAAPAFAQVPQDMTYTGRLVDNLGDPLAGPVNLELRIFDAETGPTQLYGEEHLGVALDATGGFSVQLGLGTSPAGTFDAALFSEVDRWLEVVADSEVLTPRQIIGSVPWALIAQQANAFVPDPAAPRFEDCGDGTVADHQTGLRWEQKTGTPGSSVFCTGSPCPDAHHVNNVYTWSTDSVGEPDGSLYTDFLPRLNGEIDPNNPIACLADRCDWRVPSIAELQTLLIGIEAGPGQASTCPTAPCIDPAFAAVGGPTATFGYWSDTESTSNDVDAWLANFAFGQVAPFSKWASTSCLRAVRNGGCHD